MRSVQTLVLTTVTLLVFASLICAQDEKKADVDLTSEEYLSQFVGVYEEEYGSRGEILLNEEKVLTAVSPNGEAISLRPTAQDEFADTDGMGILLKFVRDEEGTVVSIEVTMPDGTLMTAKKVVVEGEA